MSGAVRGEPPDLGRLLEWIWLHGGAGGPEVPADAAVASVAVATTAPAITAMILFIASSLDLPDGRILRPPQTCGEPIVGFASASSKGRPPQVRGRGRIGRPGHCCTARKSIRFPTQCHYRHEWGPGS